MTFKRNDNVLKLMDAILCAVDGEPPVDVVNALQFVSQIVNVGTGYGSGGPGPQVNAPIRGIPGVKGDE